MSTSSSQWNEPEGATARGTLIVLAGRGEAAGVYERFGRRLSADAYRVRVLDDVTLDVAESYARVLDLLADPALPGPKVVIGSDAGAALALAILDDPAVHVSGVILAGLPVGDGCASAPTTSGTTGAEDDAEVRSACPVHRRTLADPRLLRAGALAAPLPELLARAISSSGDSAGAREVSWVRVPVLAVHGDADAIAPVSLALDRYRLLGGAEVLTIAGGRHDALNDVSHRSVAAAIVLFLERLRVAGSAPATSALDGELPHVLNNVSLQTEPDLVR